jgi:hypothetical protein
MNLLKIILITLSTLTTLYKHALPSRLYLAQRADESFLLYLSQRAEESPLAWRVHAAVMLHADVIPYASCKSILTVNHIWALQYKRVFMFDSVFIFCAFLKYLPASASATMKGVLGLRSFAERVGFRGLVPVTISF